METYKQNGFYKNLTKWLVIGGLTILSLVNPSTPDAKAFSTEFLFSTRTKEEILEEKSEREEWLERISKPGEMLTARLQIADSGAIDTDGDGTIGDIEYQQFLRNIGVSSDFTWRVPSLTELPYKNLIRAIRLYDLDSNELSDFAKLRC